MISAVIFAHNAAGEIIKSIESTKILTNDILIVDIGSTDKTKILVEKYGAKILALSYLRYVEPAREPGIKKAPGDWILILDTDERLTQTLAEEIRSAVESSQFTYYKIPRKNIFGKVKWLKHGGWWPDHQIRLINKKYFVSWPKEIHSIPIIKGEMGYLKNYLVHYSHGDFEGMVNKTLAFEEIESDLLFKADHHVSTGTFFRKFIGELWRRMFVRLGFLDGTVGIIESIYQAFSKTITYLMLYEKKKSRSL